MLHQLRLDKPSATATPNVRIWPAVVVVSLHACSPFVAALAALAPEGLRRAAVLGLRYKARWSFGVLFGWPDWNSR
jgi:hypothetical protein